MADEYTPPIQALIDAYSREGSHFGERVALRKEAVRALDAHTAEVRAEVADEQSRLDPNDDRWRVSVDAYRNAGYTDIPDDGDRMFWEAGYQQGVRDAATIARTRKETDHA